MNTVTIVLDKDDADKYKLFLKHYVAFSLMESVGAFRIKNGAIIIDFDTFGQIRSIKKEEMFRPDGKVLLY